LPAKLEIEYNGEKMKQFFLLLLNVWFVLFLFGCGGQKNAHTQPSAEVTIVEGKTAKSEVIAVLGMPYSIGAEGVFSYYGSTTNAKINLVQKDGTRFSTILGNLGGYYYLSIDFDNKGIVAKVGLDGKN
jgi:hypothetical protein